MQQQALNQAVRRAWYGTVPPSGIRVDTRVSTRLLYPVYTRVPEGGTIPDVGLDVYTPYSIVLD